MIPKVSIIIPSFNQARFLGQAINSVVSQAYPKLEIIVIDGGSSDDSPRVIQDYGHAITYWVSEKDSGQSHAINKGLAVASGDVIGWLNSDDFYLKNSIASGTRFLQEGSGVDVVFGNYIYVDQTGRYLRGRVEPVLRRSTYLWAQKCCHANCAGFFRRRVFDSLGGLDQELQYSMDYEFYLRAATAGFKFGRAAEFWGAYRLHDASKTTKGSAFQKKEGEDVARRYRGGHLAAVKRPILGRLLAAHRLCEKVLIGAYPQSQKGRTQYESEYGQIRDSAL